MSTPDQASRPSRFSFGRFLLGALFTLLAVGAGWLYFAWNWSYAHGERAGWVQKFSEKGWLCKTWEGEIALVSMPGAIPEKFGFTVLNDEVAKEINRHMGRRVSMHYEQKVGLPTSCFGETRYYVTKVTSVDDGPNPQGIPSYSGTAPAQPAPMPVPVPGQLPAAPPPPVATPGLPSVPAPQPMPVQPAQPMPMPPPAPVAPMPAAPGVPAPGAPATQVAPASR